MNGALLTMNERVREYIRRTSFDASKTGKQSQSRQDEEFNVLAIAIARLQIPLNPVLKAFCEKRKLNPVRLQHWTEIPAIPTATFKTSGCSCLCAEEMTSLFHSSGTTGQTASRHGHSPETLALYEASIVPWFKRHLCDNGSAPVKYLALAPSPAEAPHSSLVHMMAAVIRLCGSGDGQFTGSVDGSHAWVLDVQETVKAIEKAMKGNQPLVIMGTAFSFVHLVDYLRECNMRIALPSGSRVMETGGYKGRSRTMPKAELHDLISEWLGVPQTNIVCEYGMCELSSQAYDCRYSAVSAVTQCEQERVFHFPPWARVLIISPEDGREVEEGETGLIRVCDAANIGSSIMVQTEDLGIKRGRGFELLGRAVEAEPRGCSLMS